jgi:hypothetical protein
MRCSVRRVEIDRGAKGANRVLQLEHRPGEEMRAAAPDQLVNRRGRHDVHPRRHRGCAAPRRNRFDEAVAASGHRLHVSRVGGRIAERFSQVGNMDGQDALFDERVVPHGIEQLTLRNEVAVPGAGSARPHRGHDAAESAHAGRQGDT